VLNPRCDADPDGDARDDGRELLMPLADGVVNEPEVDESTLTSG